MHSFPIYPLKTPNTVYAVNRQEAATLTHYAIAHVDIEGYKSKVLFHLMKTKPRLETLLKVG